ncbi:carboxyl transferase domain-containing protein, partial [Enterococcus faecalis]|uniref:carboxyl transferase domain-containing protein n=1 Tax=Enterococcus faecalis TaxID=1351 RepID=UPI003D6A5D46
QAEKFNRPVITFVNTAGAYCGIGAEQLGEAKAIAQNLLEMSDLKVPIISVMIGEGGSGGALALAVADEVWMLEHTIYAVLWPEGFASILWKDGSRAKEA